MTCFNCPMKQKPSMVQQFKTQRYLWQQVLPFDADIEFWTRNVREKAFSEF